jgi:hypothetical protein
MDEFTEHVSALSHADLDIISAWTRGVIARRVARRALAEACDAVAKLTAEESETLVNEWIPALRAKENAFGSTMTFVNRIDQASLQDVRAAGAVIERVRIDRMKPTYIADPRIPAHAKFRDQYVRCGKPRCHCAEGTKHGPYRYAFWIEGGRVRTAYVRQVRRGARARRTR